jgi:hypothetical protein
MSTFLPVGRHSLLPGISTKMPGIPMRLSFDYFLDREDVIKRLGKAKARSLTRVGLKVMQTARRSITKMGMAKPKLKVMNDNPGVSLAQLLRRPDIKDRTKKKIAERIFEIKFKPPSLAGTPPHTHKGTLRRDIVFAYDPAAESIVVGSFMVGGAWLASLHEFGGSIQMQAWAYVPQFHRTMNYGILSWKRTGSAPKNKNRWEPTRLRETFHYPSRPYMRTAMHTALAKGSIPAEFRNMFRVGGLG